MGEITRPAEADAATGTAASTAPAASTTESVMNEELAILRNEIRYGERLCLRTARLYRRLQTVGTFFTIVGGGAAASAISSHVDPWVSVAGAACLAIFGAALVAVRPAEKAVANEADAKRYAQLRTASLSMNVEVLRVALEKVRESDTAEIEPLRAVAFNDVVLEVGRDDEALPLSGKQRLLAAFA